jgi:OPA family glycerol-3-phosphate transporter-like MFS transporter
VLLAYFATVWTLNMYFQSYSALSLIKVNSGWFHVSERGVFSAIFGSMIQSGRFLVFLLLGAPFVAVLPWQWKFFIPAVIVGIMWLFTFRVVRDTPEQAGLARSIRRTRPAVTPRRSRRLRRTEGVHPSLSRSRFAIAEFWHPGLVRGGFEQWFPRYMQEVQTPRVSNPVFQRNALISCSPASSARSWRYASDKVFGTAPPRRVPRLPGARSAACSWCGGRRAWAP